MSSSIFKHSDSLVFGNDLICIFVAVVYQHFVGTSSSTPEPYSSPVFSNPLPPSQATRTVESPPSRTVPLLIPQRDSSIIFVQLAGGLTLLLLITGRITFSGKPSYTTYLSQGNLKRPPGDSDDGGVNCKTGNGAKNSGAQVPASRQLPIASSFIHAVLLALLYSTAAAFVFTQVAPERAAPYTRMLYRTVRALARPQDLFLTFRLFKAVYERVRALPLFRVNSTRNRFKGSRTLSWIRASASSVIDNVRRVARDMLLKLVVPFVVGADISTMPLSLLFLDVNGPNRQWTVKMNATRTTTAMAKTTVTMMATATTYVSANAAVVRRTAVMTAVAAVLILFLSLVGWTFLGNHDQRQGSNVVRNEPDAPKVPPTSITLVDDHDHTLDEDDEDEEINLCAIVGDLDLAPHQNEDENEEAIDPVNVPLPDDDDDADLLDPELIPLPDDDDQHCWEETALPKNDSNYFDTELPVPAMPMKDTTTMTVLERADKVESLAEQARRAEIALGKKPMLNPGASPFEPKAASSSCTLATTVDQAIPVTSPVTPLDKKLMDLGYWAPNPNPNANADRALAIPKPKDRPGKKERQMIIEREQRQRLEDIRTETLGDAGPVMRAYPVLHSVVHSKANNTDDHVSSVPPVPWKAEQVMREYPAPHSVVHLRANNIHVQVSSAPPVPRPLPASVPLRPPPALDGVWAPPQSTVALVTITEPPLPHVRTEDDIIATIERKRRRNLARKCRRLEGKRARDHHHQEDADSELQGAASATNLSGEEHDDDINRRAQSECSVPWPRCAGRDLTDIWDCDCGCFETFQPRSAVGPWIAAVHRPDTLEDLGKGRVGQGVLGGSLLSTRSRYEEGQ